MRMATLKRRHGARLRNTQSISQECPAIVHRARRTELAQSAAEYAESPMPSPAACPVVRWLEVGLNSSPPAPAARTVDGQHPAAPARAQGVVNLCKALTTEAVTRSYSRGPTDTADMPDLVFSGRHHVAPSGRQSVSSGQKCATGHL
jgi:hypothetical protein